MVEDSGFGSGAAFTAPELGAERMAELRAQCSVLIRRAVLTLAALPDPDARFRRPPSTSLPAPLYTRQEVEEQFDFAAKLAASAGEASPARRFIPSPQDVSRCLDVLAWLVWLSREAGGKRDVQLIFARAHGVPYKRLAHAFDRSEKTLKRWHKTAIAVIARRFWRDVDRLWGPN